MSHTIRPIAHIRTEFASKFGIPRQSGLVPELEGTIVFEPEFRNADALRGLEQYSHIWLIWHFSQGFASREEKGDGQASWSPTIRPPRLHGNERIGVFASRSPNRPNALGLSVVRITGIERSSPQGPLIRVAGADLMDGTPIFDIKPYLPQIESIADAASEVEGFRESAPLQVEISEELRAQLEQGRAEALAKLLSMDPRPGYQDDPQRVYGFPFAGKEVRFRVEGDRAIVFSVE